MTEEPDTHTPPPEENDKTPDRSGTAVATPKRKAAPDRPKPRQLPPFKVLLHNDDVSTVDHVVRSIVKLTPLQIQQAVEKTLEAHKTGVSLLLVTHQERAELYQEQFTSLSLTVTIEPDA
ncbi:MAG: ATP-dependent Clp protease adaptor ClpS [bacterium]|nr:ATP-dependent Clp protease adaptor ClpS [bacterium]